MLFGLPVLGFIPIVSFADNSKITLPFIIIFAGVVDECE
jgi:hypothetical protein